MRRGCISLGEIQCDKCGRMVPHSERYLAVEEEKGVEVEEGGKTAHYCTECALEKGYAYNKEGKDEEILTFFTRPEL
ncbi:hypothetical protein ACFLVU_02215 [Chloroflexota bacterium]